MQLDEFFDYKTQLMKELCSNENVVKLLVGGSEVSLPAVGLIYSQIFPFEYLPDTVDHSRTFICFDVDVAEVLNKTFYVPVLYVWLFTHKSKLRLESGGVRTDMLASEIDKILNGSRYYGLGELNLSSVGRFSPADDYLGRVMTYYAKDFNRAGGKPAPSVRKGYVL